MTTNGIDAQNDSLFSRLRVASSMLLSRARFARLAGKTFDDKRDLYKELGYKWDLSSQDFRQRYNRGGVAARIVEAAPKATWRGEIELIEDEGPETETKFEKQWKDFNNRVHVWPILQRADILAGLGRYSIVIIGTGGRLDSPLPSMQSLEDVLYLAPYAEDDANITQWDEDSSSERFGLPIMYSVTRASARASNSVLGRNVHHSRVLHIADNLLDDRVYGQPRLERVWNNLDDLDKISGGGAEAFWLQARPGHQINVDPEVKLGPNAVKNMEDQIDEYEHRMRRWLQTVGMDIKPLSATPVPFKDEIDAILSLISSATGLPKRILAGSEAGNMASEQDRLNWSEKVVDRRNEYAEPFIVRPFVEKLKEAGAFDIEDYDVRWPEIRDTDDKGRAVVVSMLATANQKFGGMLILPNEIRNKYLNLAPLDISNVIINDDDDDDTDTDTDANKGILPVKETGTDTIIAAK